VGLQDPSAAVPKPHQCVVEELEELEELEEEEVVVVLLINGMAKAELARAATMKETEACILKDE